MYGSQSGIAMSTLIVLSAFSNISLFAKRNVFKTSLRMCIFTFLISSSLLLFQNLCHIVSVILHIELSLENGTDIANCSRAMKSGSAFLQKASEHTAWACVTLCVLGGILQWWQTYACLLWRQHACPTVKECSSWLIHLITYSPKNYEFFKKHCYVTEPTDLQNTDRICFSHAAGF